MIKSTILSLIATTFLLAGCGDGEQEEETTRRDVLEQFDENSERPGLEEEYQEDSAFIEGTPVQ